MTDLKAAIMMLLVSALVVLATAEYGKQEMVFLDTINIIPITLYSPEEQVVNPKSSHNPANYYVVTVCDQDTSAYPILRLSINLPNNPTWILKQAYVMLEVSSSNTTWDETTVFATNYIYGQSIVYSNITWWNTNSSLDVFYVRCIAGNFQADYTFTIDYVDINTSIVSGEYNSNVFAGVTLGTFTSLAQYTRTTTTQSVANYDSIYFGIIFCSDEDELLRETSYELSIIVYADISAPASGFTLYGCPFQYQQNCNSTVYSVPDTNQASVAQIIMSSEDYYLDDGIVVVIYGFGGERSGINVFNLAATKSPISSSNK